MLGRSTRPRSLFRKLVLNGVNNSKTAIQNDCLMRLYDADSELKAISTELDSFDGKKDPVRCNLLVNQLRTAQDKVISLLFQLMDECSCERAPRDYRMKFPDEILLSEGSESLNGQIWFGAECLSAGSNILNHNKESTMLRPMAKTLTQHLDSLRNDLRDLVIDGGGAARINHTLIKKMVTFDHIFATFEYEYVRTMLPIRTVAEIEKLQEVAVLFSETLIDCVRRGLIKQDDIDEFQPIVMIAIPRLAIVRGLLYKNENPIYTRHKSQMCSLFQPFHGPLHSIRKLLRGLSANELLKLEKMLANDQSSSNDNIQQIKQCNDAECHPKPPHADSEQDKPTTQAGTSNANYANMLMDGLQYPVGQKRADLDGEDMPCQSPSRHQDDLSHSEMRASSSKTNIVKACDSSKASPKEDENLIPSPSTSLPSPSGRKSLPCRANHSDDEHRNDADQENQHIRNQCDTENCCLSPPESDAQLERLIANFSPSMNDESESQPTTTILPQPDSQNACLQQDSPDEIVAQQQSSEAATITRTEPQSNNKQVRDENQAEIEGIIQKQAQKLLQRLFVAISGVADQLQSNFASDLRFILRHIFSSEIAGDESDDDDDLDELLTGTNEGEIYDGDEDEEDGDYSNENSDSSLPIEQGIEAQETNLIDFESGYTLMDTVDQDNLYSSEVANNATANRNHSFINTNSLGVLYPPNSAPSSHQHQVVVQQDPTVVAVGPIISSQQQANVHFSQTDDTQRALQNTLDQRQMNRELLADYMRSASNQGVIVNQEESPNERSIMDENHQRLVQQHLQSVSRATSRIAAAAAAASVASMNSAYGHNMVDGSGSGSTHQHQYQVSSNQRINGGSERRSRHHHGSSRSRRSRGPPVWVPDQDVVQCSCCQAQFTLFRRRHHCRACGQIFCADCSKFTKDLNCWGYNGPVRVCESCFNQP